MLEEKTASMGRTEGLLAGREASEVLQAALQKLSPDLRETVILRDLEELEYREIAQVLNVPEGTVKSQIESRPRRAGADSPQSYKGIVVNCADVEILLADYVDGTLRGEQKSALEAHLAGCAACAELARDAAGAVAFMERAAVVEAPPELVTRILFEVTAGPSRAVIKPSLARRLFGALARAGAAAALRHGHGDDGFVLRHDRPLHACAATDARRSGSGESLDRGGGSGGPLV